jgi:hypothetical protein
MLNSLSQQIRDCLQHAEECAQRAKIECDQSIARDFLDMERRWLSLARSYAFSESLEAFSGHNKTRQQAATEILGRIAPKIADGKPRAKEGVTAPYRVVFFNNLVNSNGLPFKCIQRSLTVRKAKDAEEALEKAKLAFEQLEGIPDWKCHAHYFEVEPLTSQSL